MWRVRAKDKAEVWTHVDYALTENEATDIVELVRLGMRLGIELAGRADSRIWTDTDYQEEMIKDSTEIKRV